MTMMTEFTIVGFDPTYWRSLTPDGARREARSRNAAAKKQREAQAKADERRREELAALGRSSAQAPRPARSSRPALRVVARRSSRPALRAVDVYRHRAQAAEWSESERTTIDTVKRALEKSLEEHAPAEPAAETTQSRLHLTDIYARRRETSASTPAARSARARSFGELACERYHQEHDYAGQPIATSSRGGGR